MRLVVRFSAASQQVLPSSLSIPVSGCKPLELKRTELLIRDRNIVLFQPRDVDDVLDMYISQGKLERDPYWCRVWPSAVALAEEIFSRPKRASGLRVCELGSGLGLGSLAAAFVGAKQVILLDQEPLALLCALLSFQANFPGITTNLHSVIEQHFPGTSLDVPSSPSNPSVKAERFDWTESYTGRDSHDLLLACDLLYDKSAPYHLSEAVPRLLSSRARGELLLVDPVERTPKHRELFVELLQAADQLKLATRECRKAQLDGQLHKVELLSFKTVNASNQNIM